MNIIIIHENENRKILKIEDETTQKYSYYWLDNKGLIEEPARFQDAETRLYLSKEELQELFPDTFVITTHKRMWNERLQKMTIQAA